MAKSEKSGVIKHLNPNVVVSPTTQGTSKHGLNKPVVVSPTTMGKSTHGLNTPATVTKTATHGSGSTTINEKVSKNIYNMIHSKTEMP